MFSHPELVLATGDRFFIIEATSLVHDYDLAPIIILNNLASVTEFVVSIFSRFIINKLRENAIQQAEDGARENWHWDGVQRAMLPRGLGDLSATDEPRHERILANSTVYSIGSHRRVVW